MIILSNDMFRGHKNSGEICDEEGRRFTISGPAMIRFSNADIPKWYLESGLYYIEKDCQEGEIGHFFRVC